MESLLEMRDKFFINNLCMNYWKHHISSDSQISMKLTHKTKIFNFKFFICPYWIKNFSLLGVLVSKTPKILYYHHCIVKK